MRILQGVIVSNKMQHTVVVRVDRLKRHPKYRKFYRLSKKYKAHIDEAGSCRVGDVVQIQETRPISKEKRWKVVEVVKRAIPEDFSEEAEDVEIPNHKHQISNP